MFTWAHTPRSFLFTFESFPTLLYLQNNLWTASRKRESRLEAYTMSESQAITRANVEERAFTPRSFLSTFEGFYMLLYL